MARVPSDQRRHDLLQAGRRVLLAEGFAGLTVRRVAAEAGASLASVHYVFRDKQELVDGVTADLLSGFTRALEERTPTDRGLAAAVEGVLAAFWVWLRDTPGLARVSLEAALAPAPPDRPSPVAAGQLLLAGVLRRVVPAPPAAQVEDLARLLLLAVDGLTVVYAVEGDVGRAERDVHRLTRALCALC